MGDVDPFFMHSEEKSTESHVPSPSDLQAVDDASPEPVAARTRSKMGSTLGHGMFCDSSPWRLRQFRPSSQSTTWGHCGASGPDGDDRASTYGIYQSECVATDWRPATGSY